MWESGVESGVDRGDFPILVWPRLERMIVWTIPRGSTARKAIFPTKRRAPGLGGYAPSFGLVGQEPPVVALYGSCGDARVIRDGNNNHHILVVKCVATSQV